MPKVYDPILCMMVDEPTKARDELSLAQKKQVVVELKGYLKKSYNFSDESEYARAYEDLRHMFTTGSRKSISGLFENTVKKTGAHDSAKVQDVAPATQRYINTIVNESKSNAEKFVRQAEQDDEVPENELKYVYKAYNDKFGYKFHDSASALNKAIKTVDAKKLELGTDERQNVRKAIQLLKNAASLVNNVAMDVDNRRLGGVVNNIQNDISILEDML